MAFIGRNILAIGLIASAASCAATESADEGTSTAALGTCSSGVHECPAWGATCAGDTLQTCVHDADGCRKLVTQTCSLGCDPSPAGACKTCDALSVTKRSSSLAQPTAFYGSAVRKGDVVISEWRERQGDYIGSKTGFAAVDVSNPSALTATTSLMPAGEDALGLHIDGDRVYAIVGNRVQIWDASTPTSLVALGAYTPADPPHAVAVANGIAYVGTDAGLDIVDVTPAAGPQLRSVISTPVRAFAVAVAGKRIAVAGPNGVAIVDATDPTQPTHVASLTLPSNFYGYDPAPLAFDGQHVYVVGSYSWNDQPMSALHVLELGATNTLALRGSLGGLGSEASLAFMGGDLVVVTRDTAGTVDLTDPAAPRWKKQTWGTAPFAGTVAGASIVFATGDEGVTSVDLSRGSDVVLRPAPTYDGIGGSVTVGSIAYEARGASGLVIEDVRDPTNPVVLSKTPMDATSIALDGSLAYVTVENEGLRVYDVRSPWKPELVGSVAVTTGSFSNLISQVSLDGGRAYAMCGPGYICVFDVSQPTAPKLIVESDVISRTLGSSSVVSTFAIRGSRLYLPKADKLVIVDLSNPKTPATLGQVALGGYDGDGPNDVRIALHGDDAIVVYDCHYEIGDNCFEIVDVSDPALPKKVGAAKRNVTKATGGDHAFHGTAAPGTMTVAGRLLFLSNASAGVFVMDIGDPTNPTPLADLWTSMPAQGAFVSERFLTTYTGGISGFPAAITQADQVIELCK